MSQPGPPRPPAGTSRYTWIIGVLAIAALAYITLNTLSTDAPGSRGVPDGEKLPPFAVPLADSKLEGDAQVDPDKACKVRGSDVLNSCQLAAQGPVVLAFFATRSERCERQVDVLERVRRLLRDRKWGMPVGYDHDGAVSNAYAVAICPTITFARRGGVVTGTSFSLLDEAALTKRVEALR